MDEDGVDMMDEVSLGWDCGDGGVVLVWVSITTYSSELSIYDFVVRTGREIWEVK